MTLAITPIYAAILGLMLIVLSYAVTAKRITSGISLLHGEDMNLAVRIRRHGNFIENVPMALILMALAELAAAPALLLHGAGVLLVLSRVLHPVGLKVGEGAEAFRIAGGMGTTLAQLLAIGWIGWAAL